MNKIFYLTIIFLCCLYSCKKDHSKQPDNKLQSVKFNVSGFSKSTTVFTTNNALLQHARTDAVTTSNLSSGIVNLVYQVYNSSGKFVHLIYQTSSQANFGTISDNLPAGTYTIVFVGGQKYLYGYQSDLGTTASFTTLSAATIFYTTQNAGYLDTFGDTFYKKLTLTVSTTSTSQSVSLDRINSELELNIQDPLPATAAVIKFFIEGPDNWGDMSKFSIANSAPVSPTDIQTTAISIIPANSTGVTNYNFSSIILNTVTPFTVDIICYDKNSYIVAQRIVKNITCEVNKKTILSGSLFGGSGGPSGGGFTASIDTTWNPVQTTIPFGNSLKLAKPVSN